MHVFQGYELSTKYEDRLYDWLNDAAGEYRILVNGYEFEDLDIKNKEVIVSVRGDDAHTDEKRRAIIYSDFHGEVLEVEPW